MHDTQTPRRAAIYARISQDELETGLAIERQLEDCHAEADKRKWVVPEALIYTDTASAANEERKSRPGYRKLVKDYEAGAFDTLICYDLDRLTREPSELEKWVTRSYGEGLVLVTANGDADLSTDNGKLFARIKIAVASAEIERKGARHRRANEQRAKKGRHYGRNVPLGYLRQHIDDPVSLLIDPAMEPIVRECFRRVLKDGAKLNDIAAYLHSLGLKTQRGYSWGTSTVQRFITNPVYAGQLTLKRRITNPKTGKTTESIVHAGKGDWEPYLTLKEHETIKNLLTSRNKAPGVPRSPKAAFPLSGLIMCVCGAPMTGRTRQGGRRSYACSSRYQGKGHCMKETRAEQAEQKVRTFIIATLKSTPQGKLLPEGVLEEQAEITEKLIELETERQAILAKEGLDRLSKADLIAELNGEHEEWRRKLLLLSEEGTLQAVASHVLGWHSGGSVDMAASARSSDSIGAAYDELGPSQRRTLIERLTYITLTTPGSTKATYVNVYGRDPLTGEIENHSSDEDPQHED